MENCIFCKIAAGEIPSTKVYEDERVLAFRDIDPQAPVHVLLIPKKHFADILECDSETFAYMQEIVKKLAVELGIAEKGFRVVINKMCIRDRFIDAPADACGMDVAYTDDVNTFFS